MLRLCFKQKLVSTPFKILFSNLNTLSKATTKPSLFAADLDYNLESVSKSSTTKSNSLDAVTETSETSEASDSSTGLNAIGDSLVLTSEQRYAMKQDPFLNLVVNLVMKDGKKALAESIVAKSLYFIRLWTSSDPDLVLRTAIEKVAPLMTTVSFKLGNKNNLIPSALPQRKRHRMAIKWILEAAAKRKDATFSRKFANELISVINGDSSVIFKKTEMHKLVLANRTNAITYR